MEEKSFCLFDVFSMPFASVYNINVRMLSDVDSFNYNFFH